MTVLCYKAQLSFRKRSDKVNQSNHKSPKKYSQTVGKRGRQRESKHEKDSTLCCCFEDGEEGPLEKECSWPLVSKQHLAS